MAKEQFKEFVKKNPSLIKYVREGNMTWQGFYEIYDLYGEEESAWKNYLNNNKKNENMAIDAGASAIGIADFIKNIDLDSIQNGVNSMQRILGLFQDIGSNNETPKTEYKPRPLYKHFED